MGVSSLSESSESSEEETWLRLFLVSLCLVLTTKVRPQTVMVPRHGSLLLRKCLQGYIDRPIDCSDVRVSNLIFKTLI